MLLAVSFVTAALPAPAAPKPVFYMLPTRMWELMAGAACALLPRQQQPRQFPALAGMLLVFAGFYAIDAATPAPGAMFALPVAGTVLLLLFAGKETLAGKVLSWRPFVLLGLASYGTYLWHQPILAFMQYAWFGPLPVPATIAAIGTSVALGALSLWLIERPIRHRKILASRSALAIACFACLGIAAIAGAAGHWRLLGSRITPQADHLDAVNAGLAVEGAVIPGKAILPFVLYGDSHARQYYPALARRFGHGVLISSSGCMSLPGLTNWISGLSEAEQCHKQLDELANLLRTRKIRTLIMAQRWDRVLYDKATGQEIGLVSAKAGPALVSSLNGMMAMLPRDTNLILVGNSPTAWAAGPIMSKGYLRCRAYLNVDCPTEYPATMAEGRLANRLLSAFAKSDPRVEYVDAAAPLCPDGQCRILNGDILYYSDGSHFTAHGAQLVVDRIAMKLVRQR